MKNTEFYAMLAQRDMDLTKLAKQIFCGRASVNQVLLGLRPGSPTWSKLEQVLTKREFDVARRFAAKEGFRIAGERLRKLGWETVSMAQDANVLIEKWLSGNETRLTVRHSEKGSDGVPPPSPADRELLKMRGDAWRVLRSYGLVPEELEAAPA